MRYFDFKKRTKRYKSLEYIDTLAEFDFNTTLISLDSLKIEHIDLLPKSADGSADVKIGNPASLTPEKYIDKQKVLPLAVHEYTHFLDSTSTIWGLCHLSLMNKAYMSNYTQGGREHDFYLAKRFDDHCRNIRLPDYYTVIEKDVENTRPWKFDSTLGYIFDAKGNVSNKPIIFWRFFNSEGKLLARSPISTISLLEASAMAQELLAEADLLASTEDDFRLVERSQLSERNLAHIYNKEITEYFVCAHLVSSSQQYESALDAFPLCAHIIRTALNCPSKAFDRLYKKCPIGRIIGASEDTDRVKRLRTGLKIGDLGTLFYLIQTALPKKSYTSNESMKNGISASLSTMGLEFDTLISMRNERARQLIDELSTSRFPSIRQLAQAGYENLFSMDSGSSILSGDFNLPPVWLGDGNVLQLFNRSSNSLRNFDLDACFDELYEGQSWTDRFSEACL